MPENSKPENRVVALIGLLVLLGAAIYSAINVEWVSFTIAMGVALMLGYVLFRLRARGKTGPTHKHGAE